MFLRGGTFEVADERVGGGIPGCRQSVCTGKGMLRESHGEMAFPYY